MDSHDGMMLVGGCDPHNRPEPIAEVELVIRRICREGAERGLGLRETSLLEVGMEVVEPFLVGLGGEPCVRGLITASGKGKLCGGQCLCFGYCFLLGGESSKVAQGRVGCRPHQDRDRDHDEHFDERESLSGSAFKFREHGRRRLMRVQ